jgi:3-oxoacyl-[acyl-carrier protein] reductase|tara:strand:- start:1030 stop:1815 length:786 start_codon:yes stop_codon:yes gene_type:complete
LQVFYHEQELGYMTEGIFTGRTGLVTGGGRGIGRAICQMLAENGAKVAINFQRNQAAAQETLALLAECGAEAMLVQADVALEADVDRMVEEIGAQFGSVDLLVNNAGIATSAEHGEFGFAEWQRMFAVNVDGPFLTTWAVKNQMIAQRFGRIVNISSLAAIQLKRNMIHYATTKAAVVAFTRHTAHAFAEHNVHVNCLAPGLIDTDLARSANPDMVEQLIANTPMGRMGAPNEMAAVVKFLLSEESSFITGQTIAACGGRT